MDLDTVPPPEDHEGREADARQQEALVGDNGDDQSRVFKRGDDVELGHDLAELLGGRSLAVADQGGVYTATSGPAWELLPRERLERRAQDYAGRLKAGPENDLRIYLSSAKVTGIVKQASIFLARPGFFAEAPHGAAFAGEFARVADGKVVREPLAPAHRVRASEATPWALPEHPRAEVSLRFLRETWAGCPDVEERIEYLLQWLGVALVGLATNYKASPLLVGAKDTGKSRVLDLISACFPAGSRRSVALQSMSSEYHRAYLVGARLNVVAELPRREVMDGEAAKAILSGDPVSARHPHGRVFALESRCGHLTACNELPPSPDPALMRRYVLLDCRNVVPSDRQDRDLKRRLIEDAPAFAALALATVEATLKRGHILTPQSSHLLAQQWATDSDPVRQWAEECLTVCEEGRQKSSVLYQQYRGWAQENGHSRPLSNKRWSQRLERLGFLKFPSDGVRWRVRVISPAEAEGRERWLGHG